MLDQYEHFFAACATASAGFTGLLLVALSTVNHDDTAFRQRLDRVHLLDHDGGELRTDNIVVYRRERHPPNCGDRGRVSHHGRANNERSSGLRHLRLRREYSLA
jgi:hypothetical protein